MSHPTKDALPKPIQLWQDYELFPGVILLFLDKDSPNAWKKQTSAMSFSSTLIVSSHKWDVGQATPACIQFEHYKTLHTNGFHNFSTSARGIEYGKFGCNEAGHLSAMNKIHLLQTRMNMYLILLRWWQWSKSVTALNPQSPWVATKKQKQLPD
jgi:hypothetical protein